MGPPEAPDLLPTIEVLTGLPPPRLAEPWLSTAKHSPTRLLTGQEAQEHEGRTLGATHPLRAETALCLCPQLAGPVVPPPHSRESTPGCASTQVGRERERKGERERALFLGGLKSL